MVVYNELLNRSRFIKGRNYDHEFYEIHPALLLSDCKLVNEGCEDHVDDYIEKMVKSLD